jgi:hypothetical protein
MRHAIVLGFLAAAACGTASPTAPSSARGIPAAPEVVADGGGATAGLAAGGGQEVPFKGELQALEQVDGSSHHLAGTGTGTHLGRFSYSADIIVDDDTGDGAGTVIWIAADGDRLFTNTAGRILVADFPHDRITVGETQAITGGSGRFAGAAGHIEVERSLDLLTGQTAGTFVGVISVRH